MQSHDTPATQNLNPDPLLSMKEAAQYLGVKISTMYEIAEREQFSVIFVTTDRKFKRSVLDAYINSKQTTWRWNQFATL
mgnify:CR=1 FL=1|jgi:excisionase family DNA binding protein